MVCEEWKEFVRSLPGFTPDVSEVPADAGDMLDRMEKDLDLSLHPAYKELVLAAGSFSYAENWQFCGPGLSNFVTEFCRLLFEDRGLSFPKDLYAVACESRPEEKEYVFVFCQDISGTIFLCHLDSPDCKIVKYADTLQKFLHETSGAAGRGPESGAGQPSDPHRELNEMMADVLEKLGRMRKLRCDMERFSVGSFSDHMEEINLFLEENPWSREELAWAFLEMRSMYQYAAVYGDAVEVCLRDKQRRDDAFLDELKELILGKGEGDETETE